MTVRKKLKKFFCVIWLFVAVNFVSASDWQIVEQKTVAPEVLFRAMRKETPPTWAGVIQIKLPLPKDLQLIASLGEGKVICRQTVSQIVERVQKQIGYVTCAINGDYFRVDFDQIFCDPLGLHIQNGELVSLPSFNRSAIVGTKDGRWFITRFNFEGHLQFPDASFEPLNALNQPPPQNGWCLYTPPHVTSLKVPEGAITFVATTDLPLRPNTVISATLQKVSADQKEIEEAINAFSHQNPSVLVATGNAVEKAKTIQVGEQLKISFKLLSLDAPLNSSDIVWAIGGGPRLLRNGTISVECVEESFPSQFAERKHPRTAVGLNDTAMFWVVADGRQPGYSEGLNLYELSELLQTLGCKDAINLDGGGSSTLFVRGKVVNRPSDGKERPIASALLLLNLFPPQPLLTTLVNGGDGHWLAGSLVPLKVFGEDAVYRLVQLSPDEVVITTEPKANEFEWDGKLLKISATNNNGHQTLTLKVQLKNGNASPATTKLCLHSKPQSLTVMPKSIIVRPKSQVNFKLQAIGIEPDGQPVILGFNPQAVNWQVEEKIGRVQEGIFIAGEGSKRGTIKATLCGAEATAEVIVGEPRWISLHEFDDFSGVSFQTSHETVKVQGIITEFLKKSGSGGLSVQYDLTQGNDTRSAYVVLDLPLPQNSFELSAWVYGDGNGCWLRAKLKDAKGKPIYLDLADAITWKDEWREVKAKIPFGSVEPLILESIYLVTFRPEHKPQGKIVLDKLQVNMF